MTNTSRWLVTWRSYWLWIGILIIGVVLLYSQCPVTTELPVGEVGRAASQQVEAVGRDPVEPRGSESDPMEIDLADRASLKRTSRPLPRLTFTECFGSGEMREEQREQFWDGLLEAFPDSLGPIPEDPAQLDTYVQKVKRVTDSEILLIDALLGRSLTEDYVRLLEMYGALAIQEGGYQPRVRRLLSGLEYYREKNLLPKEMQERVWPVAEQMRRIAVEDISSRYSAGDLELLAKEVAEKALDYEFHDKLLDAAYDMLTLKKAGRLGALAEPAEGLMRSIATYNDVLDVAADSIEEVYDPDVTEVVHKAGLMLMLSDSYGALPDVALRRFGENLRRLQASWDKATAAGLRPGKRPYGTFLGTIYESRDPFGLFDPIVFSPDCRSIVFK